MLCSQWLCTLLGTGQLFIGFVRYKEERDDICNWIRDRNGNLSKKFLTKLDFPTAQVLIVCGDSDEDHNLDAKIISLLVHSQSIFYHCCLCIN